MHSENSSYIGEWIRNNITASGGNKNSSHFGKWIRNNIKASPLLIEPIYNTRDDLGNIRLTMSHRAFVV